YDMLLGASRAATAENPIVELRTRMQRPPVPARTLRPDVPEHVDQIVSRCLEPDPAKRFQTSAELDAALVALDDEGKPIPVPVRFGVRSIAAAAAAVVALVAGTWYLTRPAAPIKPHDPVTVMISDFTNQTGEPTFDHALEPMLRLALEDAGFISAY